MLSSKSELAIQIGLLLKFGPRAWTRTLELDPEKLGP